MMRPADAAASTLLADRFGSVPTDPLNPLQTGFEN
jgi:hypothetical protein